MKNWTRKEFLKASLVGGGAALVSQHRVSAATATTKSPNGDIRVAVVGVNNQGNGHISRFRKLEGVQLVALCDVDSRVLARRAGELKTHNIDVTTYTDYRKLLERSDIDAVVIATPNHWHALQTIWACQAGKDVYVEKPISHNIFEGRKAVEAAKKYNRIVQAGTQSRSAAELHEAAAYIRAGKLGKIQWARGLCYKPRDTIGKTTGPQQVPSTVDYDLWSGPAPLVPPRRNSKAGTVHYDWHWFWNYGGGDIANQGIHQMDVARWLLGDLGFPPSVMSIGGRFGYEDDAETPNTQITVFGYETPLIFEVRGLPRKAGEKAMDAYRGARVGVVIQCEGGYFAPGESGGGAVYDNNGKKITQFTGEGGESHPKNFITAVRSRKESDLNGKMEACHISSSLCHLANISYRLGTEKSNDAIKDAVASDAQMKDSFGRMIEHLQANNVDVAKTPTVIGPALQLAAGSESFVTKEKYDVGYFANTMLTRQYRAPFIVPDKV